MLRRARARLAVAGTALSLAPLVAFAAPGPNSHRDPLEDGCQRTDVGVIALESPEWVYVGREAVLAGRAAGDNRAGTRTVVGTIGQVHPAGLDHFVNHDFNDLTFGIRPDPAYMDALASGNINDKGPDRGLIEVEWETTKIPTWAWPAPGDRAQVSGAWVWDCGHWGEGDADPTGVSHHVPYDPVETAQDVVAPGAISGEKTEIHPPYEVAITRRNAAGTLGGDRTGRVLSRLDVWINGDGGAALAEEECALVEVRPAVAQAACGSKRVVDVSRQYTYRLPLGRAPRRGSKVVVNNLVVHPETDTSVPVPVRTTVDRRRGEVVVQFALTAATRRYGITVEAGWTGAAPAVAHRVVLEQIKVLRSLDGDSEPSLNPVANGPEQAADPGEWVMFASVSGRWRQLPGIAQVRDGQVVRLGFVFDLWLPAGVPPTLFVQGRECDIPFIDCRREVFGALASAAFTEIGYNDQPGRLGTPQRFMPLRRGTATLRPASNPDAGSSNEQQSENSCGPRGCYELVVRTS